MEGIFPKVKERYRDIRLLVVGRMPPENLVLACRESHGVELHPDVPDVGPFYEKCGAVVVPLLSGGGTRIKILEAAMAGRPVFSTPIGAHGLSLGAEMHLNLFTDDGSFIERYGNLDEEKRYTECVMTMHAAVQKTYSPETFERSMWEVIEGIRKGTMGNAVSHSTDG
jgi:glycosyltransferase involved in cell wall biosynthesis